MKLLVVDDDDDHRSALAEALADVGHAVQTAADGAHALAVLAATPARALPDVILLDWMMPRMDGRAFRCAQRADPRLATIPIVLMTAATVSRVPVAEIAPDATVTKPVALADLMRVLAGFGARQPEHPPPA